MNEIAQRRYSLGEIERMRRAIRLRLYSSVWTCDVDQLPDYRVEGILRCMDARDEEIRGLAESAEDELRTYMVGGVGPEELED